MPAKLLGELRGLLWALRLVAGGQKWGREFVKGCEE
jgi:hypothetical protein